MFDDEDLLQRVPKCLLIVGGIMACLQLIGFIFVHPRPEEKVILVLLNVLRFYKLCNG